MKDRKRGCKTCVCVKETEREREREKALRVFVDERLIECGAVCCSVLQCVAV